MMRTRLIVALLGLVVLTLLATAGQPQETPEEIAGACIMEMDDLSAQALDRMTTEYLTYVGVMTALPSETPVPKVFKLFSNECKKLDAIARSAATRIQKAGTKCLTRLERLGADEQLLQDVAGARDDELEGLALELRRNYQKTAADRLNTFVQMN